MRRLRVLPLELQGLTLVRRTISYSPYRTSGRHMIVFSESPRRSNKNSLEGVDPPMHGNFDPPIVEYYSSEDESQHSLDTNFETETELEMITN